TNVVALSLGEKAGWDDRYEVDEADLFNLGELPPPPAPKPPPRVATKRRTLDREIAKSAGILGALASNGEMASIFGSGGLGMGAPTLNEELGGAIGGLIAAKGTQFGSAGLGSRGSGLGGGGTAEGLGGLGTKGRGSGSSGYGSGFARTGSSANTSDPTIIGSLDRSLFDAVIKRHMHQIRYCYERELTPNPSLSGKITIKFVVAKDGSVSKASVKTNTMGNQAVGECVVSRFERMQFPQPKGGGIVIVSYPLVFQRQ
ncbi:MAG: AgmX/PglI C-terminal domain-containing protein, partial [Proteobacteria bacterium]|nr:AgmX/PglI C-terminal domain-containing protein [Pseudomonadota bacterium]